MNSIYISLSTPDAVNATSLAQLELVFEDLPYDIDSMSYNRDRDLDKAPSTDVAPTETAAEKKARVAKEKRAAKKAEKEAAEAKAAEVLEKRVSAAEDEIFGEDPDDSLDFEADEATTFDDVKGAVRAARKERNVSNATLKEVLAKHGAAKLSEIKEGDYAAVFSEVQSL